LDNVYNYLISFYSDIIDLSIFVAELLGN